MNIKSEIEIDEFEKSTLSQAPIIISEQAITLDNMVSSKDSLEEYSKKRKIYPLKNIILITFINALSQGNSQF